MGHAWDSVPRGQAQDRGWLWLTNGREPWPWEPLVAVVWWVVSLGFLALFIYFPLEPWGNFWELVVHLSSDSPSGR